MSEYVEYPQLNDPKIQDRLRAVLQDISGLYTIGEANRDTIKEAINAVSDELDVPGKLIRKLSRTYHKQSFQTDLQEMEAFELAYSKIFDVE